MRNRIKLTESKLHRMISEAVKSVLGESVLYGASKELYTIIDAANKLANKFYRVNDDDYEPDFDCDGPDLKPQFYKWAEKVADEAQSWLGKCSENSPINGGEGW